MVYGIYFEFKYLNLLAKRVNFNKLHFSKIVTSASFGRYQLLLYRNCPNTVSTAPKILKTGKYVKNVPF